MRFSGGIIFGTSLLHLFPEVKESFVRYNEEADKHVEYPVPEMMVGVGFMMVFLLEQTVASCRRQQRETTNKCVDALPNVVSSDNLVVGTCLPMSVEENSREVEDVVNDEAIESHHGHSHGVELLANNPGIKEYAFASALCLHALFEGLALGFLDTSSHVFQLLVGVSLHKATIAITLVIQLVKGRVKWKVSVAIALIFSFITPIGIAVGTGIEASGSTKSALGTLAETILQAIGAGTLLYVVVMGIILEEFREGDRHLQKSLCFLVGYLLVGLLAFIPEDHHDDDHSDHCNGTLTDVS